MNKQIQISKRPEPKRLQTSDEWVSGRAKNRTKKFCVEIPIEMHQRIKIDSVERRIRMNDAVLEVLMKKYGDE